mgnify:CR=1 FL=1
MLHKYYKNLFLMILKNNIFETESVPVQEAEKEIDWEENKNKIKDFEDFNNKRGTSEEKMQFMVGNREELKNLLTKIAEDRNEWKISNKRNKLSGNCFNSKCAANVISTIYSFWETGKKTVDEIIKAEFEIPKIYHFHKKRYHIIEVAILRCF